MEPNTTVASSRKEQAPPLIRPILIGIGLLSTLLAILGIFLPLLPTVPLLLLATACFARSSTRCHRWLLEHRYLGPLLQGYLQGRGIPLRAKISAIALLWSSILVSVFFVIPLLSIKLLLIGIATAVTVYLLRLPLLRS
ncbi:MAG: DUF454 domain-containing protein [Desulfuromonas sp.]|nr:MAG: DUF454 domain-containing protein [Desulfuromonas sp.]